MAVTEKEDQRLTGLSVYGALPPAAILERDLPGLEAREGLVAHALL
jgi:hypothetical protein